MFSSFSLASLSVAAIFAISITKVLAAPQFVFAHFLIGIVASYSSTDWENDINLAKATGIDGFALDIGINDWTDPQLALAYQAANNIGGFKMFISFDFGASPGFSDWQNQILPRLQTYATNPAAVQFNGGALVSSFLGDGFNWQPVKDALGTPITTIPNYQFAALNSGGVDGLFNWNAWPSQNNQPINSNMTTDGDVAYQNALAGKPFMDSWSFWFSTHYSPESFSKNWIFLSDTLLIDRAQELQQINPQLVEISTWNDFGESHYIGPLHPDNPSVYAPNGQSPGAIDWVTNMPHDAIRDIISPWLRALKSGGNPTVDTDEIVYWYRPFPKGTTCNDPTGRPNGADFVQDAIFAAALLTSPATITINGVSHEAPAGITQYSGPMNAGNPTFSLERNGNIFLSGQGGLIVSNGDCNQYNFNAYTGSLK